jgi:hypothetical protein
VSSGQDSEKARRQKWEEVLETQRLQREDPIQAVTFRRGWSTKSRPVLVKCQDGQEYLVKGQQAGRQIVNDRIVAKLGQALGAPVGQPKLVEIPAELIKIELRLSHFSPGIAHGTLFIPGCIDSIELIATSESNNRSRMCLLAVLYSWVFANDQQFLFNNHPPRLVHSVDHGHFFPGGPNWEIADLQNASQATLDPYFSICNFTKAELEQACCTLEAVSEESIVEAVASPPDTWGLTIKEQVELVGYLFRRKQELMMGDFCR